MATFPLLVRPAQSYRSGGRRFGDDRGDILHPGCDLMAAADTDIYAVEDGIVIYGPRAFFDSGPHVKQNGSWVCAPNGGCLMVYDLLVKHANFLVRYGEISSQAAPYIGPSVKVKEGQVIGFVGAQTIATMLHFEMYSNTEDLTYPTVMGNMSYLNFKPSKTYSRRKDLVDPSDYLDSCVVKT